MLVHIARYTDVLFGIIIKSFLAVSPILLMVGVKRQGTVKDILFLVKKSNPVSVPEFRKLTFNFSPVFDFQLYFASLFVACFLASVSSTKAFPGQYHCSQQIAFPSYEHYVFLFICWLRICFSILSLKLGLWRREQ